MNLITHFIDASNVYGSNEEEVKALRLFRNGQLQFLGTRNSRPLLPLSTNEGDDCTDLGRDVRCYKAGNKAGHTLTYLPSKYIRDE
jgi:peroxidase